MSPYIQSAKKIRRTYAKAMATMQTDPEVSLMLARKAAEAMCKVVYADKISPSTGTLMLEKLLEQLTAGGHLPKRIITHLRTIQVHGNFGSHDQGDEDDIDAAYVLPCMHSLSYVYKWLMHEYIMPMIGDGAITVKELADLLELKPFQLNRDLIAMDIFASPNQILSKEIVIALARKHQS